MPAPGVGGGSGCPPCLVRRVRDRVVCRAAGRSVRLKPMESESRQRDLNPHLSLIRAVSARLDYAGIIASHRSFSMRLICASVFLVILPHSRGGQGIQGGARLLRQGSDLSLLSEIHRGSSGITSFQLAPKLADARRGDAKTPRILGI